MGSNDGNRYRGILTPRDKEILSGGIDLKSATERKARYRIRERTKQAILDQAMIQKELPREDKKHIFHQVFHDVEQRSSIPLGIRFFYEGNFLLAETPGRRPKPLTRNLLVAGLFHEEVDAADVPKLGVDVIKGESSSGVEYIKGLNLSLVWE